LTLDDATRPGQRIHCSHCQADFVYPGQPGEAGFADLVPVFTAAEAVRPSAEPAKAPQAERNPGVPRTPTLPVFNPVSNRGSITFSPETRTPTPGGRPIPAFLWVLAIATVVLLAGCNVLLLLVLLKNPTPAATGGQEKAPPQETPETAASVREQVERLEAQRKLALAQVEEAKAAIDRAQKDFARLNDLRAKGAVAQADFDLANSEVQRTRAQLQVKEAQREQAEVQWRQAKQRLDRLEGRQ
jgi:hypothetical protein